METPSGCTGFEWDRGNLNKSWIKHGVSPFEAEEVFFNQPLVVAGDPGHSQSEKRFYALGKTDRSRSLFVCFTVRKSLIRVISARNMSRKEKEEYRRHE
jgi:uncharacterized DUF497 family protein